MYCGITMYKHVVDNPIIGGYIPFSMQMAKAVQVREKVAATGTQL